MRKIIREAAHELTAYGLLDDQPEPTGYGLLIEGMIDEVNGIEFP